MSLADRPCPSCKNPVLLSGEQASQLLLELRGWSIEEEQGVNRLRKRIKLKNFRAALELANSIGHLAEEMDHHPDLHVSWGSLIVEIWTHTARGLTELDFIWAAKVDRLVSGDH